MMSVDVVGQISIDEEGRFMYVSGCQKSKLLDRSRWFWRRGFLRPPMHRVVRNFAYLRKISAFLVETLSQTLDFDNIAVALWSL